MTDQALIVETRDRKMYIGMNRPEVLNAQNNALREGIVEAIEQLDTDPSLLVAILYGVGGRAFSVGADIKEFTPKGPFGGRAPKLFRNSTSFRHFEALRWAAKPVIAAIEGHCVGGGLEVANYCDVRIATGNSTFGQPEPRTVGAPGGPALYQLCRTLPVGEALLMQLTSQPMSAQRAYELGLIQRVCDDRDALMAEADRIADQMIQCNPASLRTIKRSIWWGRDMTAEQVELMAMREAEVRWELNGGIDPPWSRE